MYIHILCDSLASEGCPILNLFILTSAGVKYCGLKVTPYFLMVQIIFLYPLGSIRPCVLVLKIQNASRCEKCCIYKYYS